MWGWLIHPEKPYTWGFIGRVGLKAMILFIIANGLFMVLQPMDFISRLSLYNVVFDGRVRLPYAGSDSSQSYAVTMDNIPAMIASHQVARPKADDEFRVLILGNSGIWGFLLPPQQTLAPQLNDMNYLLADGRRVVAYNLAYPLPLTLRDLLLLDEAMRYEPDMVVWLVSMTSFFLPSQFVDTMVINNRDGVSQLIDNYELAISLSDIKFPEHNFFGQLASSQQALAELYRNQLYGMMWQSTESDLFIEAYAPLSNDLEEDVTWGGFEPFVPLVEDNLFFNVVDVGYTISGDIPLIVITQPMFIATGANSDVLYNNDAPRWAFDSYRALFTQLAPQRNWHYCDLWDALPNEFYTDTPFHINSEGTGELARILGEMITDYMEFGYLGQECE